MHSMVVKLRRTQWYLHLPLMVLVVLTLYPFVFMIFTSFKDNGQFYGAFWVPTWPLHGSNYADAFQAIS